MVTLASEQVLVCWDFLLKNRENVITIPKNCLLVSLSLKHTMYWIVYKAGWCSIVLYLVRFCRNFYLSLGYCNFSRLSGFQSSLIWWISCAIMRYFRVFLCGFAVFMAPLITNVPNVGVHWGFPSKFLKLQNGISHSKLSGALWVPW